MPSDTERLDFLQGLTDRKMYTGKVICRESITNRGWRLHESSWPGSCESVRETIDNKMADSTEDNEITCPCGCGGTNGNCFEDNPPIRKVEEY